MAIGSMAMASARAHCSYLGSQYHKWLKFGRARVPDGAD